MPQIEAKCCLVLLWWMWALELASIKGDTSEACNSCKCEMNGRKWHWNRINGFRIGNCINGTGSVCLQELIKWCITDYIVSWLFLFHLQYKCKILHLVCRILVGNICSDFARLGIGIKSDLLWSCCQRLCYSVVHIFWTYSKLPLTLFWSEYKIMTYHLKNRPSAKECIISFIKNTVFIFIT